MPTVYPWPRDRRPRYQDRFCGDEVQHLRHRCRRLHGRLRWHLRRVQSELRAVLPQLRPDLQLPQQTHWRRHHGSYSESVIVDERLVLKVAANLDLAGTAPLLCAGITTYSPLRHWGVTKGTSAAPVTSLPTLKSFPSKSERGLRSAS